MDFIDGSWLLRTEVLVGERRGSLGRLDDDHAEVGAVMTGVARGGELGIGNVELRPRFRLGRLLEGVERLLDGARDQAGDVELAPFRYQAGDAFEGFLELVHLVGGVAPVLLLAGQAELEMARLHRERHEVAQTRAVGWRRGRALAAGSERGEQESGGKREPKAMARHRSSPLCTSRNGTYDSHNTRVRAFTCACGDPSGEEKPMKDLAGKTAFVTGAASGIGLGIATALAQAGVKVMLCDVEQAALA